mgnify:CR=1 FL=1
MRILENTVCSTSKIFKKFPPQEASQVVAEGDGLRVLCILVLTKMSFYSTTTKEEEENVIFGSKRRICGKYLVRFGGSVKILVRSNTRGQKAVSTNIRWNDARIFLLFFKEVTRKTFKRQPRNTLSGLFPKKLRKGCVSSIQTSLKKQKF